MIVIHVSMRVKVGSTAAFEPILRSVVAEARRGAGCLRYEWYRVADPPHAYAIYGEFTSRELFELYLGSSVVQRIGKELRPLLAGEPEFAHYEATLFEGNRALSEAQP